MPVVGAHRMVVDVQSHIKVSSEVNSTQQWTDGPTWDNPMPWYGDECDMFLIENLTVEQINREHGMNTADIDHSWSAADIEGRCGPVPVTCAEWMNTVVDLVWNEHRAWGGDEPSQFNASNRGMVCSRIIPRCPAQRHPCVFEPVPPQCADNAEIQALCEVCTHPGHPFQPTCSRPFGAAAAAK